MAKYCFKIYTDTSEKLLKLEDYEKATLQMLDRFSIESTNYYDFVYKLADKLQLSNSEIKRVVIFDTSKEREFSIISGNHYLKKLLDELSSNKAIKETTSYQEMKQYLFEQLHSQNYSYFLDKIYTDKNHFRTILHQYAVGYHQGIYKGEEERNLLELKRSIEERLQDYKNFRGLSICRQKNENWFAYSRKETKNSAAKNIQVKSPTMFANSYYLSREFPTLQERTVQFNLERDEYLDPSEYESMYGEDTEEVSQRTRLQ